MIKKRDKYELYEYVSIRLKKTGLNIDKFKEINFGLQFNVLMGSDKFLVRIYEGKKGTRLDLSQVKDPSLALKLEQLINDNETSQTNSNTQIEPGNQDLKFRS